MSAHRRSRLLGLALALAAGLSAAGPAAADLCTLDTRPAATLLLPYFEVDLDDPNGRTTLVAFANARPAATLTRFTLWTDLGVPSLSFDVYLTGYDVQTVNLRDLFEAGRMPRTADFERDPDDTVSPRGSLSQDSTFPGCSGILPLPLLPPVFRDHLRAVHTGGPSPVFSGRCSGRALGDRRARGYVTIDTVSRCSVLTPAEPGYFGPGGLVTFDNVLWGDFYFVDRTGRFAQGQSLVALEADPQAFAGKATFYRRFVGHTGADGREPLPSRWALRYLEGGAFTGGTDLLAWREGLSAGEPFPCGDAGLTGGYPLALSPSTVFDEQENPDASGGTCSAEGCASGLGVRLAAANRLRVGEDLPAASPFGFLELDLSRPGEGGAAGEPLQGWVGALVSANGRYSVGLEATPLATACPARCAASELQAEPGQLCAKGPIVAGQPVTFQVVPRGCHSSSCTRVVEAECRVASQEGASLRLEAFACLEPESHGLPCTPDCSGGGFVTCPSLGPLAAGTYTVTLGELSLELTVPSPGDVCTGSPFS